MSLSFTGYQTRSVRFQRELESSAGEVLGATAEQAFSELPLPSIVRMAGLARAELSGQKLDADTASHRIKDAGLEGRLTAPTDGISDEALNILIDRKREEIQRQDVMSRSPGGFGLGAAQLSTALATSMLDPLNVGLAFVPVVSQARYLRYLANARGTLGRTGVRAGVGAAEGAAGAAIIEPLVYAAKTQEQADYDFQDSLLNIAFGTVFGGGLHTSFGAMADAVRRSRGKASPWAGLEGLVDDADVTLVQSFREDIASGRLSDRRDIDRVLDTWSPQARKAVADVLPTPGSAAARVTDMPLAQRESMLRVAMAQAMRGKAVDVDAIAPKRQIDTSEFMLWFGESAAVDQGGKPLRLFHGTIHEFESFRVGEDGGIHFGSAKAANARLAETREGRINEDDPFDGSDEIGENIHPVYLSIRNPLRTKDMIDDDAWAEVIENAKEDGYDGIVYRNEVEGGDSWIAFDPQQIKSAFDSDIQDAISIRAAAERQASPESDITADVRASEAADAQLAEQPIGGDEVAIQEALLADEMTELQDVARIAGIDLKAELAEFDEAIELAETYGKAARAAALCGMGH